MIFERDYWYVVRSDRPALLTTATVGEAEHLAAGDLIYGARVGVQRKLFQIVVRIRCIL